MCLTQPSPSRNLAVYSPMGDHSSIFDRSPFLQIFNKPRTSAAILSKTFRCLIGLGCISKYFTVAVRSLYVNLCSLRFTVHSRRFLVPAGALRKSRMRYPKTIPPWFLRFIISLRANAHSVLPCSFLRAVTFYRRDATMHFNLPDSSETSCIS